MKTGEHDTVFSERPPVFKKLTPQKKNTNTMTVKKQRYWQIEAFTVSLKPCPSLWIPARAAAFKKQIMKAIVTLVLQCPRLARSNQRSHTLELHNAYKIHLSRNAEHIQKTT